MHVLRLTPHFYWPQLEATGWPVKFDAIGGMQTQIYRLTEGLAKLGVRQTVLTLKIPLAPESWEMNERVLVRGVRIPIFPFRSRVRGMVDLNLAWSLGVVRHVLLRPPDCEIIHVHCSGVFWPLLVGTMLSKLLSKKLVLTIHCSILATYESMSVFDPALMPFSRWCERKAIETASRTLVLTPRLREFFAEQGYETPDSIDVIPDLIDVNEFRSAGTLDAVAQFRARYALPDDRPIISYIGRIAHEKGWPHFIELAERLRSRPVHFLVCGDGNERDKLERIVREKGLQDRFTVTGYVPQGSVPAALANTDVLILTSLHEEFGGILIEGMAMGIPVVAFAVGGIPHVVKDGQTGLLVPAPDVGAMAAAVERLIDDPAGARRMGSQGVEHVSANYDMNMVTRRLHGVYKELVS